MVLIISLAIGAILWVLYHKLFHVVYFGGTFQQILSEMLVCVVLGFVITIFGANVLDGILAVIIKIVVVIIKIIGYALLAAAIIFGIWLIYKIIKAIVIHVKKKRGTYVEKTEENAEVAPDEVGVSDNEESNTTDDETVVDEESSTEDAYKNTEE